MNRSYSFDHGGGGGGGLTSSSSSLSLSSMTGPSSSSSTSFGNGYQPLCFSKEVFTSESFKVDSFIADCRKRVPLESVQKDLKEYTRHLDAELVELINKEYHSFFSLSSSLAGIDVGLNEFNDTLSSIKSEISNFKGDINKVRECVEDKLKEKKKIDHSKKLLQLYISVSDSISNINGLFEQLAMVTQNDQQQQQQPSNMALFSPPSSLHSTLSVELVIDRISNSFFQIQRQIESLAPEESSLKLFKTLQLKVVELSNKIELNIDPIFQEALKTSVKSGNLSSVEILSNCLKTYQVLKKIHIPYKIVRKSIIKPYLISTITIKNLENGLKGSCEGLSSIYSNIISYLQKNCSELFMVSNSINTYYYHQNQSQQQQEQQTNALSYNFISESILPEVDEQIAFFRQIFATGIPDLFFRTYNQTNQFISALEDMCPSPTHVIQLRNSPSYQSIFKKWNFAVYFQLCFSNIASSFETQLSQHPLNDFISTIHLNPIEKNDYYIPQSFSLCQNLDQCWSKNIFIYELSSKFFKMFLQMIARYEYNIQDLITPLLNTLKKEGEEEKKDNTNTSTTTNTTITTTPSATTTTRPAKQVPIQESLVYLYSDLLKLSSKISVHYKSVVLNTIRNPSKEIEDIVSNGIKDATQSIQKLLSSLDTIITSHFKIKCSESLLFINTLSSQYRLTNKPFPTSPSQYVSMILNPLETFLNNKAMMIPSHIRVEWVKTILAPVSEQFLANANETLSSVTKLNETLRRMKGKKTDSAPAAAESNVEKLSLQFYLDVVKYGQLISKLGVDIQQIQSYTNLLNLVEPFKIYLQQPAL
ncbi:oligomeric Golgi complex component [Cavenderia fasciculata]|uniref:Conserved oligomeric Golgi complex subunit 2 n=1 Tax=Cavenderia fasciculata TaxID=261658 RepID=F4QE05_CACFS|nr:oligomeric Golgi complex component [Cavenderia fasciculata]EGG13952.1 oligomeric Golgi complex component [Cavenderia fasciculata]|eukprot:XP_004350660.1 oligomeric Golgi complex component [Cavenderia fasciculata]